VGGWLAAGLARAGADVRLFARGATLAALQSDGLVFAEGDRTETFRVPASGDTEALRGADILLLGLKGHDVPAARETIAALAGEHTRIVPALNGIPWWFTEGLPGPAGGAQLDSVDPAGALARAFAARRVIGCVAHVGSKVEAPGRIRLMKADRLLLGEASARPDDAATQLAALFQAGGVPARVVDDIRTEVWSKLWGNMSMNPVSALARADLLQIIDDPGTHRLMVTLMQEMAGIGDRIGLPLTEDIPARIAVARRLGAFRTSMLQDLEAGRRLEIGPIIGALVELADRLAMEVPVTRSVHGLTRMLAANLGLR
jgi:2-dehydropantoate 2-reductase